MAYVRMGWPAAPHGGIGEIYPTQPAPLLGFFGEVGARLAVIGSFPLDSWTVQPAGHLSLIALARRIMAQGPRVLSLVGHTDRSGTEVYNQGLGQRRADEVRRQLLATLERMSPNSSRGIQISVSSAGASQATGSGQNPPDRRVEIFGPPSPGAPPPPRPPSIQVPPPPQPVPLEEAVSRSRAVIAASPMPVEQKNRLTCMLAIIQRPEVDDRFVNGHNKDIFRMLTGDLSDQQIGLLLHSNRVRRDLAKPWFGPGASDQKVAEVLDLLDQRIMQGIATLRRHRDTEGATMSIAMRKVAAWVTASQRNPKSIYSCFAE
jgi:OmpA family